jgi:hypothetical protein
MTIMAKQLEPVLDRVGVKERAKIDKHLAACDAEGTAIHGRLWRRIVGILGELAPLSMQSAGSNTWRFFIADGKYRMQVFALEDPFDGMLRIYLPDVLTEALKAKVLVKTPNPQTFAVAGKASRLKVESLGAAEAAEAPPHYKHMLGWNRKALRLTVSTTEADDTVDRVVQSLAAMASKHWVPATAAAAAAVE